MRLLGATACFYAVVIVQQTVLLSVSPLDVRQAAPWLLLVAALVGCAAPHVRVQAGVLLLFVLATAALFARTALA